MKYEVTCTKGSFLAWGSGFRFNYEAKNRLLDIAPLNEKRILLHLKLDEYLAKNPLIYVESFNKTSQIKALMYSNNATTNLAEIMDGARIGRLIESTANISRCVFDLRAKNFKRFARFFCQSPELKSVHIKKFTHAREEKNFYIARIQTRYNNSVCVRACTLTGLTAALSERTLHDLITMEFGHRHNDHAHRLLNISTRLSTISRTLDHNFVPEDKLAHNKTPQNQKDMVQTKRYKKG